MRFVHVADVHLDASFSSRSEEVRARLRTASREAFRNAVDLAVREDVHALLIAGDLFDGEHLSFETERLVVREAERLADHGIGVVYATGNHDPGSARRAALPGLRWPKTVRVASDSTPRRFAIQDHTGDTVGHVTAIGHETDHVSDDLSRLLPVPAGVLPEVALLHTQVRSSPGASAHRPYAPSDLTYLRHAGYDYWALGHVHAVQELSSDPPIWYCGSLQGRSHAEQGGRGALIVDLSDRGAPLVSFRELAPVRWQSLHVSDLEHVATLDALERRVQMAWEAFSGDEGAGPTAEWMLRVVLEGACPLWSRLRDEDERRSVAYELREGLGVLDVVLEAARIHPVVDLDEYRSRTDVLGAAMRLAAEILDGRSALANLDEGALVGAPRDDPEGVARYVRELLNDADGELASRLLRDGGS